MTDLGVIVGSRCVPSMEVLVFPEGKHVLLIDDAARQDETAVLLRGLGLQVTTAIDAASALERSAREEFDLAIVAAGISGDGDNALLTRLRTTSMIPSLVLLADPGTLDKAIQSLSQGADDYLVRPVTVAEVRARIGRLLKWQDVDDRALHLQKEMSRKYLVGNLVSRSEGMRRVREQILQVASARSNVLILGESGVGKELVAKAIHYNSPRREAPFIAINCSAIPVTLIESELFGHERGAFTGAVERRKGKFELAHGGTIFLDEIGDMDLQTQSKLLRVLEEREFMRVGGGREVRVDVRVLAATNSDLEEMVTRRAFREDLYFRLKVITIRVPPLRERIEDIPDLARAFVQQICRENGLSLKTLTPKAVRVLRRYAWPGNARELKNILESTIIIRPGDRIKSSDLPAVLGRGERAALGVHPRVGATLRDMERALIRRTLIRHAGNRTHAAQALNIGVRTLQRKMRTYAIHVAYVRAPRATSARKRETVPGEAPTYRP